MVLTLVLVFAFRKRDVEVTIVVLVSFVLTIVSRSINSVAVFDEVYTLDELVNNG